MIVTIKFMAFCLIITNILPNFIHSHVCDHKIPSISELVVGIESVPLPPHVRRKRSASQNLRIHFDYQSSFTSSPLSEALKTNLMEPSKKLVQSLLTPRSPNNGLLLVDRSCINSLVRMNSNNQKGCASGCTQTLCLGIEVPSVYLKACKTVDSLGNFQITGSDGAGISYADIVLLVTYTSCTDGTLAYAGSCFMESILDRPILGVVNLCSNVINPYTNTQSNIKVVIHEIIHSLGFSVDKYAFYRYQDGSPIVPRNAFGFPNLGVSSNGYYNWNENIIKSVVRPRKSVTSNYNLNFYGFVLPNVLAAARVHFDCPTLEAVDLENYGGPSSALSHFDEYFLFNEIMTPQNNNGIDFLSRITLALLQDTGWYNVDYSAVGNFDYGHKKGCILPEQGCYNYMQMRTSKSLSLDPFCNTALFYGNILDCSIHRNYFYRCSLFKKSFVDPAYQYFTSLPGILSNDVQFYTGLSPYNEYCPGYYTPNNPNFLCNDESNNNGNSIYNSIPSYFGPDSLCINTYMYNSINTSIYGATCQKSSYNSASGYSFLIGTSTLKCPSNILQNFTASNGALGYINCSTFNIETSSPDLWNVIQNNPTTPKSLSTNLNSITYETLVCLSIFMIIKSI